MKKLSINKISDSFNFLSKLTLRRLFNTIKVLSSFYISRWIQKPIQWGLPMTISIEPTTACNLRCPECPSGLRSFQRPTGNLPKGIFQKIIDELHAELLYLIFYFQGEPYINPDFLEMVKEAVGKNIYTITSTNGHFLDDENAKKTVASGLDRLIISVDGASQEVYESYRKEGDLEKVLEGAKNIIKWKRLLKSKTPHVVFQFLVVRPNEHEIPKVYALAKEIGIDEVKLKTAQIYDYKNGHPLIPLTDKYSRYRQQRDGTFQLKNKLINQCWKLWHSCVFTWDGRVVPCCFDKDAQYQLGEIGKQDFKTIWQNEAYQNFRKKILSGRNKIDICTNCSEGSKVWF